MKRVEEARVIKLAEGPPAAQTPANAPTATGATLFPASVSTAAPRPVISAEQIPHTTTSGSFARVVGGPPGVSVFRGGSGADGGVAITAVAPAPSAQPHPPGTLQIHAAGANPVVTQPLSNLKPEPIGKLIHLIIYPQF